MPGWGHYRHTHTAAETIPSDMIISGLGTRLGSGTEGWGENHRHLYWVLAASSLLKVGLKTPKEMDFSCTLLNGAAFYKQPKNLKILPAPFFVSLSLEVAILTPAFFPPPSFPRNPTATLSLPTRVRSFLSPTGTALRNWPLLRKSCLQILGPEKSPGTGLLPNKAESYMRAIKRHLFI